MTDTQKLNLRVYPIYRDGKIVDYFSNLKEKIKDESQKSLSILVGTSATFDQHLSDAPENEIGECYARARRNCLTKMFEEQIMKSAELLNQSDIEAVENPVHKAILEMVYSRTQRKSHQKWFVTFNPEKEVNDKIRRCFTKLCDKNPGSKWVLEYRDEKAKTGEHIHAKLVFNVPVVWSKVREKFRSIMQYCGNDQHLNVKPIYDEKFEQNIDAYMVKQEHNK